MGNNGVGNNGMVKAVTGPTGVKRLRSRVRRRIEVRTRRLENTARGHKVIRLLNKALAIEIVCILRYKRHYFISAGLSSFSAKAEFLHHAMEEQIYADPLAERIVQLGGEPNVFSEEVLSRSHPEYVEGESLREVITEDLHAKRVTINSYRELVASLGTDDPVTSTILESILMQKEEHVADRASLLKILGPESKSHHSKR